jgi:hypothetical protein
VEEVLNHLRDRSGLPISMDDQSLAIVGMNFLRPDGQPMQFRVKATNEKAGGVLRRFLNNYRLSYVIFENSVLITTDEMAVMRQMRQRVSVNLEDVPANKAIRDLARGHGVNLVIDPSVGTLAETRVSLQVDNTGIETALRLLAELASLKAVRMGNVMFVTNETKAKKIRDEEPHQFDNPLNPHLPGGNVPPVIGFGGIAMPPRAILGNVGGAPAAPAVDLPLQKPDAPPPPANPGEEPVRKKVVMPVPQQGSATSPPAIQRPDGGRSLPPPIDVPARKPS